MKRSLLLLLFVLVVLPAAAQSIDELFQQALRLERVQGDYRGAIAVYEQIVDQAGSDRTARARALVDMGKAYESLGRSEAVSIYERVLREYADQADEVAEARARMAGLVEPEAPAPPEPGVYAHLLPFRTEGNSMDAMYGAAPSYSGHLLARESAGGGITIDDLTDGTIRDISTEELGCAQGAYTMRFSPDDSKLAFSCWGDPSVEGSQHLRVYDFTSGRSGLVTTGAEVLGLPTSAHFEIEVYDWTLNGDYILASVQGWGEGYDRKNHVSLVPIGGGQPVVIDPEYVREEREFREMNACLMNDDSVMLAEYGPWDTDDGVVDVRITDIPSQTERVLLGEDGADYELFGCDKEEGVVFYSRKRFETMMLRAADLTPGGDLINHRDIRVIRADTDAIMSQNGDLYYTDLEPGQRATLEVEIDPKTGSVSGDVRLINDSWGAPGYYSAAGNLALSTEDGHFMRKPDGSMISLPRTESGGHVTDLAGADFWLPRNPGSGKRDHFIVDGVTGLVKDSVTAVRISPDHQTLLVPRFEETPPTGPCLDAVSRDTNERRPLFCMPPRFGWVLTDPVSGRIAYEGRDDDNQQTTWVVDPNDGSKTEVSTGRSLHKWGGGKLYIKGGGTDFRRYDPQTGDTRALPTLEELEDFFGPWGRFAISQDERRLAIQGQFRRASGDVELTVIRDPLSLAK